MGARSRTATPRRVRFSRPRFPLVFAPHMLSSLPASFDFPVILAAGGIAADKIPGFSWFTNSILVAVLVTTGVLLFTRMATKRMSLIPGKKQNFVEFVVEFLYGQVEEIVGKHVAPKVFPILATVFIFILVSNWSGLIPGVGTIGFGPKSGPLTIKVEEHGAGGGEHAEAAESAEKPAEGSHAEDSHAAHDGGEHAEGGHGVAHFVPIFRPATADLNMTLGLATVFMLVWAWVTVSEVGVWGFIVHTFGPKGGLTGFLKFALVPIFIFVGLIEIVSIVFRPISLSFRLLGNIYAGESLLHTMGHIGETLGLPKAVSSVMSVVAPLPFYFMEILVGLIQAIVFTLLCAVYVQLSTAHAEEDH